MPDRLLVVHRVTRGLKTCRDRGCADGFVKAKVRSVRRVSPVQANKDLARALAVMTYSQRADPDSYMARSCSLALRTKPCAFNMAPRISSAMSVNSFMASVGNKHPSPRCISNLRLEQLTFGIQEATRCARCRSCRDLKARRHAIRIVDWLLPAHFGAQFPCVLLPVCLRRPAVGKEEHPVTWFPISGGTAALGFRLGQRDTS